MNKQGWQSFLLKVMSWWAFDIFMLISSTMKKTDTAAQTILRSIVLFTYMIPVGLSSASNFLTG
jgi:Na+-driven multidrug efflux pump